jgi:hypothetical protein
MKTMQDYFENSAVKGSILGSMVMFIATPGINYVVSRATNSPMPWAQPFTGGYSLAVSGAAGCATTFCIKSFLTDGAKEHELPDWTKFWTSFVAGLVSGAVLCPFESIAQTQLSTNATITNTATLIYKYHGALGFCRGLNSMMLREGAWSAMYMALAPILKQRFKDSGYNEVAANLGATSISFGIFGVISTPINRMRIMMQENLAEANTPSKTYKQLINTMLKSSPNTTTSIQRTMGMFKGAGPRSMTSALAGGLFVKGTELYDDALKYCSK